MCLSFRAKGEIDTGEALPAIQIRKRYSPSRRETILELVRPQREPTSRTTFWFCLCGSRMHTDILVCTGCGQHRHHHRRSPREDDKVEKAYQALRKEIVTIEKELKDLKKDSDKKKDEDKPKDNKNSCKCEKKDTCRCARPREEQPCNCIRPPPTTTPKPNPCLPPMPYIPVVPGLYPGPPLPPPQPEPPAEVRPCFPAQEPPIVNVIVPEGRDRRRRRSHHRKRSSSVSSSSTVSIRSFTRIKNRVSGLGRRVWGLEGREQIRDEEARIRAAEQERRCFYDAEDRTRRREESRRERVREREVEYIRDDSRERARLRNRCPPVDRFDDIPGRVRIMPFPYGTTDGEGLYYSSSRRAWQGL